MASIANFRRHVSRTGSKLDCGKQLQCESQSRTGGTKISVLVILRASLFPFLPLLAPFPCSTMMPTIWKQFLSSPKLFTARSLYSFIAIAQSRRKIDEKLQDRVRLVCISDTHNSQDELPPLPEGDILLHAGDMSEAGTYEEVDAALAWISAQKHPHKIVIAGNHDAAFVDSENREKLLNKYPNVTFLQDEVAIITVRDRLLHFYGNAQTPLAVSSAFAYPRISGVDAIDGAKRIWGNVPPVVDVLITHGPPAYHLDEAWNKPQGCPALLEVLWHVRPTLHVFGHIHSGRGVECLRWSEAQAAYERVRAGLGSFVDLLCIALACMKTAIFGPGKASAPETVLANVASHLEMNDGILRAATVLDI